VADVVRYRPEDRRAVDALYRRVFGIDAAEASRLRWDWQYRRNPNNPGHEPEIWIAREGTTIVGQYATMPVQVSIAGSEVRGSWGMDVMVAPERQRQGLGEVLFRTWDRNVGASLGLGLSDASYRLFQKLRWPDVGPVPCLVKPLTRRGDVPRSRAQEDVQGLLFRNVDELERHRTAHHPLGVHELGFANPGPLSQDLPHGDILGDDRSSAVGDLHRQLAGCSCRRRPEGRQTNDEAKELLSHMTSLPANPQYTPRKTVWRAGQPAVRGLVWCRKQPNAAGMTR